MSNEAASSLRLARAHASLEGLSVGDAFGECLFEDQSAIELRLVPPAFWPTTDDTEMAIALVDLLRRHGGIEEDLLALAFAGRFAADRNRGYGPGTEGILTEIRAGGSWREAAERPFGGQGSLGNGSAMRVAPVGAYFADEHERLIAEATRSAVVTHAHPDGVAGAIAIAVAAAWACRRDDDRSDSLFEVVLSSTPTGATRAGIEVASRLPRDADPRVAGRELGTGWNITCADTVPFCLWAFARHLDDYREALWTTVSVPGDRDTNCAIVGGLVAAFTGVEGVPDDWRAAREPLRHDLDLV
jgi:ADP-ribosylglycohydrolase